MQQSPSSQRLPQPPQSLPCGPSLIDALRTARRDAGLTGAALATRIGAGWGQPKVSKIESGRQLPTTADITDWANATSTPVDHLLALHARAMHEYETFREAYGSEGGAHRQQEAYAAAEQAATVINGVQPFIVHGLRQTPDYALALPGGPADHGATPDEIDHMIAARMRRSAILYEPGRQIQIIIGQAALLNQVGDAQIMADQRQHLLRLIKTVKHATIGILPFDQFPVLIQHGWDQRDNIVTLETTAGDLEIADPTEVQQYAYRIELIVAAASTTQTASTLIDCNTLL